MAAGRKLTYSVAGDWSRRSATVLVRGALLAVLLIAVACTKAENNPTQVANQFVKALRTRDEGLMDGLMAWDSVAIYQYYVSGDYYKALDELERKKVVNSYRDLFFKDYFPEAATVAYSIDKVYIDRATCNTLMIASFPRHQAGNGKQTEKQHFSLEMRLFKDRNRWYIVDLNDFVQLNMLRGDYDRNKFYLPEPVQ